MRPSRVAQTSSRLAKRDAIAGCLRNAEGDEIEIAVAYLSGETRQGRLGVGYATLAALRGAPAAQPVLTLRDVDAAFERVASTAGKGSAGPAQRAAGRAVRARHRRGAGLPAAPAGRRAAPGRARRGDDRRDRGGGRPAGEGRAPRGDARRRARARSHASRSAKARKDSRASPWRCTGRCSRCSRSRRRRRRARWRASAAQRSNGSSTARACRSTRRGGEVRVYTRSLNDVTAVGARDRRGAAARCRRAS